MPDETDAPVEIPKWVEQLVSVYYRTTQEQGGLPPPEQLRLEPEGTWRANLPELDDAVDALIRGDGSRSDFFDLQLKRLALAQFARAAPPSHRLRPRDVEPMHRLAQSLLVARQKLPTKRNKKSANRKKASDRSIDYDARKLIEEFVGSSEDGDARFAYAYNHAAFRVFDRFKIREFWTARSLRSRVSDTSASILVERPVSQLAFFTSPLTWKRFPIWNHAYYTPAAPSDLNQNPARGQPGDPLFYEDVVFGWNASPVARYRNLLGVAALSSATASSLRYWERICLTTVFLGGPRQAGGIEADEGSISAEQVMVGKRACTRLTGRKRFRGGLPKDSPYRDDFAALLGVLNPLLVEAGILLGSQMR